jgi:hypothetical protein
MKMGRHSQRDPLKDEQYTPRWMFDHMGIEFDLDVAAPTGGAPHVPARRYYTEAEDGLVQPWSGLVFMNPPYSSAKPWVEKFMAHGNGIALLPFSKSQWFRDLWEQSSAISAVLKDVEFETPTDKKNKIFMQVALFAMGEQAKEVLINAKISRVR